jgi:hypothetical protein
MAERLPAHVEVAAIMRRAEVGGGFAAVLRKGDPDRGTLILVLQQRGETRGILERELGASFSYEWVFKPAGSESVSEFVASRERFDTDFWLIELDVAEPERFVAETTSLG